MTASPALDDVLVLVSEVASNAVKHTASGDGGAFEVAVWVTGGSVRVEIGDQGGASEPRLADDGPADALTGGRGLRIVDAWRPSGAMRATNSAGSSGSRCTAHERGPGCPVAAVRGSRWHRYRELQALEDAVNFRLARLMAPCPRCEPAAAGGRCDEHACDVALIAGYLEAAHATMTAAGPADPGHAQGRRMCPAAAC